MRRVPLTWTGLLLAFASALVINSAHSLEHDAVAARGHPSRLARREQSAVVLAVAGLMLLGLSLAGRAPSDDHPPVVGVIIWLVLSAVALGRTQSPQAREGTRHAGRAGEGREAHQAGGADE